MVDDLPDIQPGPSRPLRVGPEGGVAVQNQRGPDGRIQVRSVSWWHANLMEFLIINPHMTQGEIAKHFDVTQTWLSIIINSDAFQAEYRARLKECTGAAIAPMEERARALAELAIDTYTERLEKARYGVPLAEVREGAAMALKALGIGGFARGNAGGGGSVVNQVTFLVGKDQLAAARASIRETQATVMTLEGRSEPSEPSEPVRLEPKEPSTQGG